MKEILPRPTAEDLLSDSTIRVSVDVNREIWKWYRKLAERNHRSVAGQLRADLQSIVEIEFDSAERQEGI